MTDPKKESPYAAVFRARRRCEQARFRLNRSLEDWVRGKGTGEDAVISQMESLRIAQDAMQAAIEDVISRRDASAPVTDPSIELPDAKPFRGIPRSGPKALGRPW